MSNDNPICQTDTESVMQLSLEQAATCLGKSGYPRKAGQFGVGHVLYGTKFNHEFSHPAEDRPTWDIGPKAA